MTNSKTKHSLFMSVISLILCASMLLGTTWAWFTDSVTSTGNVIKSGTLDVSFEWMEGNLDPTDKNSAEWIDASTGTIFNSTLWEPGYTEVKHIKIENEGDLALKYTLDIIPYDENGKVLTVDALEKDGVNLAKAIDVYYLDPAMQITDRTVLAGLTPIGTLYEALKGLATTGNGKLLAGELETVTLALKMQEGAGNEYQDKSIGASFAIRLMATQYTNEQDSFDEKYDTDSKWPIDTVIKDESVSADVTPTVDNKVAAGGVSLTSDSGKISATLPEGVQLEDNTSKVTLTVSDVEVSEANITLSETEATLSVDVHIDGVATTNDKPIEVAIDELLPVGLNMGNYRFYHVENGATVEMTLLEAGNTPVHNNYTYDPATGNVTLYLKSFSEVSLVVDTENPWEGVLDYSWYESNPNATEFTIANGDQLAALGAIVGGMDGNAEDSFAGKTITLISDVNLGDKEEKNNKNIIFYPIGYWNNEGTYERKPQEDRTTAVESYFKPFEGTFDGNGHTISNFYQNTWEMKGDHNWYDAITEQYYRDGMGLFGKVYGGTVKNLTVANFSSDGEITTTGVIAAYADSKEGLPATFENIAILNCNPRVYNIGNGGIVGCAGWYSREDDLTAVGDTNAVIFKNITVDNTNKISALWGSYDVSCGGILGQYYPDSGCGVKLENCHIAAQIDAYNDVCGNYQYYWYRYSGMLIGTIRKNTTDDKGYTVPDTTGITAENCTVHFDKWNDYYYCELVANSLASYTHDHQFSRLVMVDKVDLDAKTVTVNGVTTPIPTSGRYNYGVLDGTGYATKNVECFHFVDGARWLHKDAGYEKDIDEDGDGNVDLKEDKQHIYLPFNQLFTGDGWGVKHMPVGQFPGVTILDRESADSETKFTAKLDGASISVGKILTAGELFAAIDGKSINNSGVLVSVEALGDDSTVTGKFTQNPSDWRQSTVEFNGTGSAKVIIQDYDYCKPTTLTLDVVDMALIEDDENTKILGLAETKTYKWAPVSVLDSSEWSWTEVSGITELDLDNGLYAVRLMDDAGEVVAEKYVHLFDKTAVRDEFYEVKNVYKTVTKNADNTTTTSWLFEKSEAENVEIKEYLNQRIPKESRIDNPNSNGKGFAFDPGYWSNAYNTLKVYNVERFGSTYFSDKYTGVAFHYGYNPKTEAEIKEWLPQINATYSFKSEEIVPIEDLNTIKVGYKVAGANNALIGSAVYKARLKIYVACEDCGTKQYEIDHAWDEVIDIQSKLPDDAHGYVTALQFFPVVNNLDEVTLNPNSGEKYIFLNLYDYSIKPVAEIGEFDTEINKTGYRITGLDTGKSYAYSADKLTWTPVPAGSDHIDVENVGTYYIKVLGGDSAYDSVIKSVTIEVQGEITGRIYYEDGKIKGLDADKSYEYGMLNINETEWIPVPEGSTEFEAVNSGVYAVRLAETDTVLGGEPEYVWVEGDSSGIINWGTYQQGTTDFVQGKWTAGNSRMYADYCSDSVLYPSESYRMAIRLATGDGTNLDYDDRLKQYYRYALEDDEVFPVSKLGTLRVNFGYGNGNHWPNAKQLVVKYVVHVAGGTQSEYSTEQVYNNTTTSTTRVNFDPSTFIPADAEGYVTGIEFYPWYDVVIDETNDVDETVDSNATNFPVIRVWFEDTNPDEGKFYTTDLKPTSVTDVPDATERAENKAFNDEYKAQVQACADAEKWVCNLLASDIKLERRDDSVYINGYKLTGFDPDVAYEYSVNGGAYTALEAGATEFIPLPGIYKIRTAKTDTQAAGNEKTMIVPFTNPVFGKIAISPFTSVSSDEFVEGKWAIATHLGLWSLTAEEQVTARVYGDNVLSTVSYKYKFLEEDYFEVNRNPWFSIGFNNYTHNMGVSYPTDAVFAIDIYVEGEDAPYRITTPWKGNTEKLNMITVNLLDLVPKIEGKTVVGFDLRPYSTSEETCLDYNTESTGDRYIYFRLYHVGFYDTPANVECVRDKSGVRVNTLVGLEAAPNRIFELGDIPRAEDFTVYEVYSDGKKAEVETVDVITPLGFGSASGTYTVTVKSPRGVQTTTNITVS